MAKTKPLRFSRIANGTWVFHWKNGADGGGLKWSAWRNDAASVMRCLPLFDRQACWRKV
jgi:hypothetical protein